MNFLADTNVVSETRRPRPNPFVQAWLASVPHDTVYLSVLVLGEIRQGIERLRRRDPLQAARHEAWLTALRVQYENRILPVNGEVAEEWGRLSVPDPLPIVDGLLAATARVFDLTLVTRNTADFARTGVPFLNPFEPGAAPLR